MAIIVKIYIWYLEPYKDISKWYMIKYAVIFAKMRLSCEPIHGEVEGLMFDWHIQNGGPLGQMKYIWKQMLWTFMNQLVMKFVLDVKFWLIKLVPDGKFHLTWWTICLCTTAKEIQMYTEEQMKVCFHNQNHHMDCWSSQVQKRILKGIQHLLL